ncbi:FGGY-family carbohydrate kinase [Biformimicrobium ophioploci]|uniref:FGGY-family carbohydrate kinase n=1 Tax=Biformimicrobium ophioploci TaxID=3036711 RepID=A0ABQ6M0N7_9GAMM|nr:FGGY-family carbohydrate kinase [Microbulbifer sp. NKW57]GMG87924.1 FGGY-family carbohydrate kinase [Microbulbifer sp. NKW57]
MPQQKYLLAIDNGTQSVRAMVFDCNGNLVARSQVAIEPYFSREPGWAEQAPGYFWEKLCKACQLLWPKLDFPREQIEAVTLTAQRATGIYLDSACKPLRPAIVWMDQRKLEKLPSMGFWGTLIGMVGQSGMLQFFRRRADSLWVQQHEPDIWRKTHRYLLLSGYHTYRLTGAFRDAVSCQVGYLPFNYRRQRWGGSRDWKWAALPLRREQLPELVAAGDTLGSITAGASGETGIPAGLPLIAAGADKACEVLGAGGLHSSIGNLSFGTTATFNQNNTRYVSSQLGVPAFPAAVPGHFNTEVMVQRGFWMVSWFLQEFGAAEIAQAKEQGLAPEALLDRLLDQVPAGADGLLLLPDWQPGIRSRDARGAIVGFTEAHTRAHMYRALVEGIMFALRHGCEQVVRRSGQPVSLLRASGGGAVSERVLQICADVFNLPVERVHTTEASGLGAAINAAVGAGLHADYPSAVRAMVRVRDRFEPNPENAALYDAIYHRAFRRLGSGLKPVNRALGALFKR